MAARCCSVRWFVSSLTRQRLKIGHPDCGRLYIHPSSICRQHCAAASKLPAVRTLHTAASFLLKDAVLDEQDPFYEKYGDKLDKIKGFKRSQVQARAARLREKSRETAFIPPSRPSPHSQHSLLRPPSLDSVVHIEKIAELSSEDIATLWREYHKDKDAICAIIPTDKYKELLGKAIHCPYFIYPLPRDEGYEFMFAQFSGHRCHFASLINYQQYQENAPVALTLTHYTQLQDSKGIVLMSGEVDTAHLTSFEAQYLANQVQLYYNSKYAEHYSLLRQFNHEPDEFDHRRLLEQLANSTISTQSSSSSSSSSISDGVGESAAVAESSRQTPS